MIRSALTNRLAVMMICLGLLAFAAVVTPRLSVDTFPELTPPVLVIGTQAPGMGPTDVEKTLTWRFEKYVSATPGVDHVQSVSRAGLSIIYVWLKWGTDLNAAQTLVQQQVQFAMSSVPKSLGVVPPFVLQYDPTNTPVAQIAVYGGGLGAPQLYDYAQNVIEPIIEGIPGVASASPNGGRERQINVIVDPLRAQALGVTSSEVGAAVARANALLPSGRLISANQDANVYTNAVPGKVRDIGDAPVKEVGGRAIFIRDIARLEDGGSPETQAVSINGEEGVYLNVLRVPGGNVIAIVDEITARLEALENLPPGMRVETIFDQSSFVRSTFNGLKKEIVQAFVLVAMVILIFLQSWRSVLVAAIAVPISFAMILLVLYLTGQTLNAFTLGGLTLAMGPLVDISVVVIESIHRRRLAGASASRAPLEGTRAVAMATLASTLATVAVLLPVVLLEGLARKLFAPLAVTVATGMVAGYVVSMLVTPVAAFYLLRSHQEPSRLARRLEHAINRLAEGYATLLRVVLPYRATVLTAAAVLIAAAVVGATRMPTTFFPELDESMERVYVRFAPGTSLASAAARMREMARVLREEMPDEVSLVLTNTGSPGKARSAMNSPNAGPHMGFIRLQLVSPEHREASQRAIADRMRELLTRRYPGVDFLQAPGGIVATVFNNGYNAPLAIEVEGDDLETLRRASVDIADAARRVRGLRDPYVTLETSYPELRINTDRATGGLVGITARDAAQTTLEATLGNINSPAVWVDGGNGQSYFVVTQYDGAAITDRDTLVDVPVRATVDRGAVKLGSYARVVRAGGPIAIERNHLARVATILFQTGGRDLGSVAADLEQELRIDPRTRGLHFSFVGQVALMRTTFSGLGLAIGLAVMLIFTVMVAQFRSLRLPLVMLFTVPLAFVGVVLALFAACQGLSITSLMGMLMVIGIAMSNGILLVDHANRVFQGGVGAIEAVIDAGRVRFVPIMMTSLATIVGLAPTALGLDRESAANQPLALAVVGGLITSTALSLFLVPVMFTLLARRAPAEELDAPPVVTHEATA